MHSNHGFTAGALESVDGVDASTGAGASVVAAVTAGKAIVAVVGTNDDSLDEFESGAEFTAFGGALAGPSVEPVHACLSAVPVRHCQSPCT